MPNPFEPGDPLASFSRPESEFQVNVDPATDIDGLITPEESLDRTERSFRWPLAVFSIIILILTFRLINLQVTEGVAYQVLAKGNRIETRRLAPPRGVIVDQFGNSLTQNLPLYQLNLYPAQLPKQKEDRQQIYDKLERITGIKASDIIVEVDKKGLRSIDPITLRPNLDRDTALLWQVDLGFLSGLVVEQIPVRSYEPDLAFSHAIGYVGKISEKELPERPDLHLNSIIGKAGLEQQYDRFLQGTEGKEELEVDSKGQLQRVLANEPPRPGKVLELYVDKDLQKVMAEALKEGAEKAGSSKGVALAIDPRTGGVLGMVSLPSYDNNLFVLPDKGKERSLVFADKNQPLFNRVIAGLYPPGSTTKPIWAVAGLQEKIISEKTNLITPSEIRIGRSVFPDWKPHGRADVKKAIAESNNIFFYALAGGYDHIKGLGPARLKDWGRRFGWGYKTGIDLPGEVGGLFPDPDWKKKKLKQAWYIGDTYHLGIGQGYLSLTPVQLANSIAAIANDGKLFAPRLAKSIKDSQGNTIETLGEVMVADKLADSNNLRIVREGMRQTVLEGSATPLADIAMPIAGKTGTAQFEEKDKTHAWFVGFAPFDQPTITLLVMVEGGGGSFDVAVPIAKKILSWYSVNRLEKVSP